MQLFKKLKILIYDKAIRYSNLKRFNNGYTWQYIWLYITHFWYKNGDSGLVVIYHNTSLSCFVTLVILVSILRTDNIYIDTPHVEDHRTPTRRGNDTWKP